MRFTPLTIMGMNPATDAGVAGPETPAEATTVVAMSSFRLLSPETEICRPSLGAAVPTPRFTILTPPANQADDAETGAVNCTAPSNLAAEAETIPAICTSA